jgi:hypothetical protein
LKIAGILGADLKINITAALGCSLIGVATSELAELSASVQNAALGVPPVLAHPRQLWVSQIPEASFPAADPVTLQGVRSIPTNNLPF